MPPSKIDENCPAPIPPSNFWPKAQKDEPQAMAEPCALFVLLLRKFAIGKLSATEVQEFAAAAIKSGLGSPGMQDLQNLGAMGHQAGNAHRDLVRKYFPGLVSPEPWRITCEMMVKEEGHRKEKVLDCFALLPHSWVLALQENELLSALTCSDEDLACFWKTQMGSPQMTPELKALVKGGKPSQLPIPWLLHGDGAPFTEVDSLVVLSMRQGGCQTFVCQTYKW